MNTAPRRRHRLGGVTVALVLVLGAMATTGIAAASMVSHKGHVGSLTRHGYLLPSNQTVSPYGRRVLTSAGRLLSSNLSPDGTRLAALSYRNSIGFLSIFDVTGGGRVLQEVGTGGSGDPKLGDATVAADGPFYSPDGRTLWVPQSADLLKFAVNADGTVATTPTVIPMATGSTDWLPSGMAYSADGSQLYVALNNLNTVAVLDPTTGAVQRQFPVGVAPRQIAVVGGQLYVSNEGGRQAAPGESSNLTSGTAVVADRKTGAVKDGTLSVVNPATGYVGTIPTGLEPTALFAQGTTLFVANSNDDSVSIVDTTLGRVVQTFNVNPVPGERVGSYPNAITMPDSRHLLVSIGRDNALALYRYTSPRTPVKYIGLVPTDWYPVAVQRSAATGQVVVTNDKGIGARGTPKTVTEGPDTNPATALNTYSDTGSLTMFAEPQETALRTLTHRTFVDNGWTKLDPRRPISKRKARSVRQHAVPRVLGGRSPIKHVFLVVKENRTYDQVFGDVAKGNGAPSLAQFGANVTPNHHALAKQFGLFDNFYDEGTLSADGHNWLMQADANDYIEKEFGAFYRSYPAQGGDALAYQRNGFLWNAVEAAGKSVHNYGEYNNFFTADDDPNRPTWAQWFQDSQILEGKASGPLPVPITKYRTYADIGSLNAITDPTYPRFDTDVPDQYRTDIWLRSFRKAERTGRLANLTMMWVPDDHTAGTSGASPYPTAAVADNDLAVGRIVGAISHSRFWKSSAVFVVEDDSQAGTDHVDGHRAPILIASPYARRHVVDHTYYTQLNVVKTIEQILGVRPMNQEDRAAVPMYSAFTDKARFGAYRARPNRIPLTYGLAAAVATSQSPGSRLSHGPVQQVPRATTAAPAAVPPALAAIEQKWAVWSKHQHFGGAKPEEDAANPAQLNRLDWYSSTGWTTPYPGDTAVLGPYQVPGWDRPAPELN